MTENTSNLSVFAMEQQFEALGTKNQITVYDSRDEEVIKRAVKRVMEIDDKMSAFKPSSEISNLNQNSGKKTVRISEETLNLLETAIKISQLSEGAFDITIGPLVRLWGIGKHKDFIPIQDDIVDCSRLINYQDIVIDKKNGTAYLQHENQSVDLGGIAKGYAADEVKRILLQVGVNCAMINLGGNIITIGKKPDRSPWKIGIQNPLALTGEYIGTITVDNQTIVTSGVNERFFVKSGIRYHHLLDPRSGEPARNGLLSVTVVCDKSIEADALTTALFVLGMEKGISLLKYFAVEAIFLTDEGQIYITDGLRNNYQNKI